MASTLWHIGNTTVRTPYRLREALLALENSGFCGNLMGTEREEGFAQLLNQRGVLKAERISRGGGVDFGDLGRKWRSALGQLGFVAAHLSRGLGRGPKRNVDPQFELLTSDFPGLSGRPYEITPNGRRLIEADTVAGRQECFLRALAAYKIPSKFEPRYKCARFSPFRFVLDILLHLEKAGDKAVIAFDEMALYVQRGSPDDGIDKIVSRIRSHREKRGEAEYKKRFDSARFEEVARAGGEKPGTLIDYADLNFRYLKATGLFLSRGRGIAAAAEKRTLIDLLVSQPGERYNDLGYVKDLWNGARLPTDDKIKAVEIVQDLVRRLAEHDVSYEIEDINRLPVEELSNHRYRLEERLRSFKELAFAGEQAHRRPEISAWLKAFKDSRRRAVLPGGETVTIPGGEGPAYFEWIIWRAFLAVDSLENKPWEARKFAVDQDFLPLSHAPAGGPDMVFEFKDFVLVVEVTLSTSSRQEAAEGEPVRRHVAEIAEKYEDTGKRVYCLFIAVTINSNTAETFKIGCWYKPDDTKLPLQIVPIGLDDFIRLFEAGKESDVLGPMRFRQFLTECRALSNMDAPEWKKAIGKEVNSFIHTYMIDPDLA